MPPKRPYGLLAVIDIANRFITPIALIIIGAGFRELKVQGESVRSFEQWRSEIPQRMTVEADKLKLEVMRDVERGIGLEIRKIAEDQARIFERIKAIDGKLAEL